MTREKKETTIPLYVIVINKTDGAGNAFSGPYRGIDWVRGVSRSVFSYADAVKTRYAVGGKVQLFKEIGADEVDEWAKQFRSTTEETVEAPVEEKEAEPELNYQQKMKALADGGHDWTAFTENGRSKKDVDRAYEHFIIDGND